MVCTIYCICGVIMAIWIFCCDFYSSIIIWGNATTTPSRMANAIYACKLTVAARLCLRYPFDSYEFQISHIAAAQSSEFRCFDATKRTNATVLHIDVIWIILNIYCFLYLYVVLLLLLLPFLPIKMTKWILLVNLLQLRNRLHRHHLCYYTLVSAACMDGTTVRFEWLPFEYSLIHAMIDETRYVLGAHNRMPTFLASQWVVKVSFTELAAHTISPSHTAHIKMHYFINKIIKWRWICKMHEGMEMQSPKA